VGADIQEHRTDVPDELRWPVIFSDFDGTRFDSIELIINSFRAATAEVLGRAFDEPEVRGWIGRPLVALLRAARRN
jgi:phosphoglycolate phosphatase-like HAD superfamily hydrolase